MKTESFRKQHAEILDLGQKIKRDLLSLNPIENSIQLRSQITGLLGKVQVHLAMEDNVLYPKLIQGFSQDLSELAKIYQQEMGDIKKVFTDFTQKWTAEKIAEQPEDFKKTTLEILAALENRIEKENNHLYALYDAL